MTDGRVCCVNITETGTIVIATIIEKYSSYVADMLKEQDSATVDNIKSVLEILMDSAHRKGKIAD